METTPRSTSESEAFDELLETRLRQLLTSVANTSLEDIEGELTSIGQLIKNFKQNDELLEGLLDPATSKAERKDICTQLEAQHLRVAQDRDHLERLHDRSHHCTGAFRSAARNDRPANLQENK